MIYKSIILPLAQQDIREAAEWYNDQQKGLGKKFTAMVRKKVRFICKHPNAYSIRYQEVRTAVLDTFSYMVHYTVKEENKEIIISAVMHTSRNSDLWRERSEE